MLRTWTLVAILAAVCVHYGDTGVVRENSKTEKADLLKTLERLDALLSHMADSQEDAQTDSPVPEVESQEYKRMGDGPMPYKRFGDGPVPYKRMGDGPMPYKRMGDGPMPYKRMGDGPMPYKRMGDGPMPYKRMGDGPMPYKRSRGHDDNAQPVKAQPDNVQPAGDDYYDDYDRYPPYISVKGYYPEKEAEYVSIRELAQVLQRLAKRDYDIPFPSKRYNNEEDEQVLDARDVASLLPNSSK